LVAVGGGGGGDAPGTAQVASLSSPGAGNEAPVGLRVLATDGPFAFSNVKSATVDVQRIDLHQTGEGVDAFLTIKEFPEGKELDLVQLRNGITDTLFEGNPPPGSYDEVRIVVLPKQIVIDDQGVERQFNFKVPSGPQTGIKVFIAPAINVTTNLTTDLLLDFDLSRSFEVQGNPATPAGIKGFHFKPVIRAVNTTVAGTLTFQIKSDNGTTDGGDDFFLDGAAFTLTDASGTVAASGSSGPKPGDTTVTGYAFHPGITEGDYTLTLTAPGYDPYEAPVTIRAGNLTDLGVIPMVRTLGMITGSVTTQISPLTGDLLVFAVPEAAVETGSISVLTDNAGSYQITDVPTGDHALTVTKTGYETFQGSGTSAPASDPPVKSNFSLVPLKGDITGKVTDGAAVPVPVQGATVQATIDFGGAVYIIKEATTDAQGVYTLSNLPTAAYNLVAVKGDSTGPVTGPIDILGGGAPMTQDITLPPPPSPPPPPPLP